MELMELMDFCPQNLTKTWVLSNIFISPHHWWRLLRKQMVLKKSFEASTQKPWRPARLLGALLFVQVWIHLRYSGSVQCACQAGGLGWGRLPGLRGTPGEESIDILGRWKRLEWTFTGPKSAGFGVFWIFFIDIFVKKRPHKYGKMKPHLPER